MRLCPHGQRVCFFVFRFSFRHRNQVTRINTKKVSTLVTSCFESRSSVLTSVPFLISGPVLALGPISHLAFNIHIAHSSDLREARTNYHYLNTIVLKYNMGTITLVSCTLYPL
ncbi:hypothetical protein EVAR_17743_1 [Eumeta japonica]|uniref:Uncharacterized protein n=1 Tax=Eumeta variegata TaxID=151549 RepID=A0A4C1TTM0_EUMVA|nr:hypothetical protein EVAR_17743_1 [Eumeta japonica]